MDIVGQPTITLPGLLKVVGSILLGIMVLGYVIFQARHLIVGPQITLTSDVPASIATSSVVIQGIAENITSLSLNGRTIFTTDTGVFEEVVVLPIGYTMVTIEAVDRYGAHARLERGVVRTK
jgi:hypothetical protein